MVTDWTMISSLVTAGERGCLQSPHSPSVRSGSRVTRVVEQALQVNQWPLLMPSRLNDLMQKIFFSH